MPIILPPPTSPWSKMADQYSQGMLQNAMLQEKARQAKQQEQLQTFQMMKALKDMENTGMQIDLEKQKMQIQKRKEDQEVKKLDALQKILDIFSGGQQQGGYNPEQQGPQKLGQEAPPLQQEGIGGMTADLPEHFKALLPLINYNVLSGGQFPINAMAGAMKPPETKEPKTQAGHWIKNAKGENVWVATPKEGEPPPEPIPGQPSSGKVPSSGNAVDAAIRSNPKYGTKALTDPELAIEADKWLGTKEGKDAVAEWSKILNAERATPLPTPGGYSPFFTGGPNVGQFGKETGVKRPLTPEMTKDLSDFRTTYETMQDVYKKAKAMKDKFGPIEGRWTKLKLKFMSDGPTQEVFNEISSLITIAYALSGKQISEREMQLLQNALLPRLEQPKENFLSTLRFSTDWLARIHNNRLESYGLSGHGTDMKPLKIENPVVNAELGGKGGTTRFVINGKTYNIPNDKVEQFKKDKGIK